MADNKAFLPSFLGSHSIPLLSPSLQPSSLPQLGGVSAVSSPASTLAQPLGLPPAQAPFHLGDNAQLLQLQHILETLLQGRTPLSQPPVPFSASYPFSKPNPISALEPIPPAATPLATPNPLILPPSSQSSSTPLILPNPSPSLANPLPLPPVSHLPWDSDQLLLLHNHLNLLLLNPIGKPTPSPNPSPKTYASCLSHSVFYPPPVIPPSVLLDGRLTVKIPIQMVDSSKQSFSHSAIGKFVGRRPSLEALEQREISSWCLSRPCLISLTEKGNFIFRFNTKEDREDLVGHSPLLMEWKKLLLRPSSPSQDESSWPIRSPSMDKAQRHTQPLLE
eukprot:TRINITY_DN6440_c0_g1_i2.p1 TRINITY_DN6440_c0_g1~~TRINITY_DN6440_c0_g1_i2.p1  ORF type:complete len:334 (-),score=48.75 TRINITY_DN6440_c0_g1_i2:505-1506(-)